MKTIELCTSDKAYKIFIFYDTFVSGNKLSTTFELMHHSIKEGSWQFVDLKSAQKSIEQDFKYLILRKHYNGLKVASQDKLTYDDNGFHLDGHDFETLDEVHAAMNNKAFL
jgi:hypothetical protein